MKLYHKEHFWHNCILRCPIFTTWPPLCHVVTIIYIENPDLKIPFSRCGNYIVTLWSHQMITILMLFIRLHNMMLTLSRRNWRKMHYFEDFCTTLFEDAILWFILSETFTNNIISPVPIKYSRCSNFPTTIKFDLCSFFLPFICFYVFLNVLYIQWGKCMK